MIDIDKMTLEERKARRLQELQLDSYTIANGGLWRIVKGAVIDSPHHPGDTLIIPESDQKGNPITTIRDLSSEFSPVEVSTIIIPNTIKKIEKKSFLACINLTELHIPASVESIADGFALYCRSLRKITVDPDNKFFDSRNDCNAIIRKKDNTLVQGCKSTIIPNGVENIGQSAFEGCEELEHMIIPGSVKKISDNAFSHCTELKTIAMTNGIERIGKSAFFHCYSLESIYIPDSVKEIGTKAFDECDDILYIRIPSQVKMSNAPFVKIKHPLLISSEFPTAEDLRKKHPKATEKNLFVCRVQDRSFQVYTSTDIDRKIELKEKFIQRFGPPEEWEENFKRLKAAKQAEEQK